MVKFRYSSAAKQTSRAWSVQAKLRLRAALQRVGWQNALNVSLREQQRPPPPWQSRTERFLSSRIAFAVGLLAICAGVTVVWGAATSQDINQLWSEMGGMTLDVLFILIIYEAFAQLRGRREAIERQLEIIDDYKRWDAEEASLRLAGALRRLGRLGVSKANFSGLRLSSFKFAEHGVPNLRGSTFYDGDWGNPLNDSAVRLNRVSFDHVDCTDVQFSPFDPFEAIDVLPSTRARYATFVDCSFADATLVGAVFNGAELRWTEVPPESHYDWDEDEDGTPYSYKVSEGPFCGSNLAGAQFRGCRLQHADFRDARNLRLADFYRAAGVEAANFDSIEDRDWAIASAAREE